jgi:hypothetical protein
MRHRRHPVEQVRGMTGAGLIAACPVRKVAPEWPSGHANAFAHRVLDQRKSAVELGRQRQDGNVRTVAIDQVKNLSA